MRITFLLFIFFSFLCKSQINISGKVVSDEGHPVEFAQVSILKTDSSLVATKITGIDGAFEIFLSEKGTYQLVIYLDENEMFRQLYEFENSKDLGELQIASQNVLSEVTVSGNVKISKGLGKYVVTNIAASPLAKNNYASDFLATLPMIKSKSDNDEVNIRNKSTTVILINGKEVGGQEAANAILKSTPAENIKEIEIMTNPGSKYAAGSNVGVINIIIQKPTEGWKGSFGIYDYQRYYNNFYPNANVSFAKKKWLITSGLRGGVSKSKNNSSGNYEYFNPKAISYINTDETTKSKSISPYFNLNYEINDRQNLGFQVNYNGTNSEKDNVSANQYFSGNMTVDSTNAAQILTRSPNNNSWFFNTNYSLKTDTLKSELKVNLYYYDRTNNSDIYNNFNWTDKVQKILQSPDITTDLIKLKTDFSKNFINEDVLEIGFLYSKSKTKNDFFYGNFVNNQYIPDIQRSNTFVYKDEMIAAYAAYSKILGDKWEARVGLRWENYLGKGTSDISESTRQKTNNLFPNISLVFYAGDEHELSLDYESSIYRAPYWFYNPNVYYTSANSYQKYNANLLPIRSNTFTLGYNFLEHYNLNIDYDFGKNAFTRFRIVQPNGQIEETLDNYGDGHSLWIDFTYTNQFFKNRWNFTTVLTYIFDKSTGSYNGVNLDFTNNEYWLELKNYIYFNEKKDFILSLSYMWMSNYTSINGTENGQNSLNAELSKSFKNWNFKVGAYNFLNRDKITKELNSNYSYYIRDKYYQPFYFRISYFFGNKKVKEVRDKSGESSERLNN